MKKLISIFMLLFTASLLFADLESDKKQILSLFKKYEFSSINKEFWSVSEHYNVWDYNDKKMDLLFVHQKNGFFHNDINYICLGVGAYRSDLGPVSAECPSSENRYPVKEFRNEFNSSLYSFIGKAPRNPSNKSTQVTQHSNNNTQNNRSTSQTAAAKDNLDSQKMQVLSLFKRYELVDKTDWKSDKDIYKEYGSDKEFLRHEYYKVWDYENTEGRLYFSENYAYKYYGNKKVVDEDHPFISYRSISLEMLWMPPTFKGPLFVDEKGDNYYLRSSSSFINPAAKAASYDDTDIYDSCRWTENRWPVKEFLEDFYADDRIIKK